MFIGNLEDMFGATGRQNWVSRWTNIGDAHCLVGELNSKKGASAEAAEAWLCALTAFEVARRLVDKDDPEGKEVSAKVETGIQRLESSLDHQLERISIPCYDQTELLAYYLPAGGPDLCAPAVICISREEEPGATLLGRLLPVVIGRGMSVLVVAHDDLSNHWRGQSDMLLSCCLDYLSLRPDVDAARIGIYGEGMSAALATHFAVFDNRVAAAVCDGGAWNSVRVNASVKWITGHAEPVDEGAFSARRLRLLRQLNCPVLVVAGGRGIVSVSEAIKLKADCLGARTDLELTIPPMSRTTVGEIENFLSSDDSIFGWLERKLHTRNPCCAGRQGKSRGHR
ncbi:hypothetical protein [Bradyrhizobium sp. Rc2d]|uniref:hypothetical protein n=1 Tax=Bradyrhizobium sp. Rc2d TaxID=1855321 RepID=UPI000B8039D5|nr:hypothetical protein [Bradyrhizobium sp. Rc2d]